MGPSPGPLHARAGIRRSFLFRADDRPCTYRPYWAHQFAYQWADTQVASMLLCLCLSASRSTLLSIPARRFGVHCSGSEHGGLTRAGSRDQGHTGGPARGSPHGLLPPFQACVRSVVGLHGTNPVNWGWTGGGKALLRTKAQARVHLPEDHSERGASGLKGQPEGVGVRPRASQTMWGLLSCLSAGGGRGQTDCRGPAPLTPELRSPFSEQKESGGDS